MASQESLPEEEKEELALELSKVPPSEVESVGPVLLRSKWEELIQFDVDVGIPR